MLHEIIVLDDAHPEVRLETYILRDSPELLDGKKRAAILICPGGAYLNCSDREAEPVALRFAAMGYHAFILRYHVFFENGEDGFRRLFAGEDFASKDQTIYPAPILDIAHAMTVISQHAQEWLVDEHQIILCGFSAGGHNVLNYATHYHEEVVMSRYQGEFLRPAAVIAGYPLTDYVFLQEMVKSQDPMAQRLFEISNLSLFGTTQPDETLLKEVSPSLHVTKEMPPVFLWTTAADNLVDAGHTIRMALALTDAKVSYELHIFEEGNHGLSLATQASAASLSEIQPAVASWVAQVERWLTRHFPLPVKKKSVWE